MIDIELIRREPNLVKEKIILKRADPARVDALLAVDCEWRRLTDELDDRRHSQKEYSEKRDIEAARKNKEEMKVIEARVAELERERELVWKQIPNIPDDDVPQGKDESENKVVRKWGEPRKFDFAPKDHADLGEALGVIDMARAAKVSGARFAYLKGDLARLEYAIVSWVFAALTDSKVIKKIADKVKKGYSPKPFLPVVPPVMIRPEVMDRMARLEPRDERYYIPSDDMYLIGSAEHTLGPMHMEETIPESELPIRYIGFSTSFRREAGTYGKDMRGILRMHQFDKLEMESFTAPEHSRTEQDFLVAVQEYLMQALEIPYQIVMLCTGDMGGPNARQIDLESWMPGQGRYRETHSADLMTDYQSRRLGIKVRRADGKNELLHMNDATAIALSRTPIAIMENYQTKEGNIKIPKILQKYVGKKIIVSPNLD